MDEEWSELPLTKRTLLIIVLLLPASLLFLQLLYLLIYGISLSFGAYKRDNFWNILTCIFPFVFFQYSLLWIS